LRPEHGCGVGGSVERFTDGGSLGCEDNAKEGAIDGNVEGVWDRAHDGNFEGV